MFYLLGCRVRAVREVLCALVLNVIHVTPLKSEWFSSYNLTCDIKIPLDLCQHEDQNEKISLLAGTLASYLKARPNIWRLHFGNYVVNLLLALCLFNGKLGLRYIHIHVIFIHINGNSWEVLEWKCSKFGRGWYQISYLEQKLGAEDKYVWELQIGSWRKWNYLLNIGWAHFFEDYYFSFQFFFLTCAKLAR